METKELSSDKGKPIIFISHSSKDRDVAKMLAKFFYAIDIPRDNIFCSSLTGNGVKRRISDEVKAKLKASVINIAILSRNYYDSAYCLSEAGVIWYRDDVPVMLVALPEINEKNLYSFFDKNDILRRLDSNKDILDIYEEVSKAVGVPCRSLSAIAEASAELMKQYADFLKSRSTSKTEPVVSSPDDTASNAVSAPHRRISVTALKSAKPMKRNADFWKTGEAHNTEVVTTEDTTSNTVLDISGNQNTEMMPVMILLDSIVSGSITDDEKVVMFYLLEQGVRKVSKDNIVYWLFNKEICDVNVDNAFDNLSTFGSIKLSDYQLELEIQAFRKLISNKTLLLSVFKEGVDKHKKLASDTFKNLWANGEICSDELGLFIAYIIDEKVCSFYTRSQGREKDKKIEWLQRNKALDSTLSDEKVFSFHISLRVSAEIEKIKRWQRNNALDSTLSEKYESQVNFFIENSLVYNDPSWVDINDNGRSYKYTSYHLYPSLEELIFNSSEPYRNFLNMCKKLHRI